MFDGKHSIKQWANPNRKSTSTTMERLPQFDLNAEDSISIIHWDSACDSIQK